MKLQVTREFSTIPDDCICVGYISGVFGVRGEVKVFLHNVESDLFNIATRFILLDDDGKQEPVELSIRSGAGKKIIGKLKGITDRNIAESKVGHQILFKKRDLPELPEGEWYMHQLLGLPVFTESGQKIGEITEIIEGDVDIWVAENDDEVVYLPNTDDEIISVDLTSGVIVSDNGE